VREVTGKTPTFELCPGLLEIRFYAERGMPAYAYGPGLLSISHGPKEFVDTAENSPTRGASFVVTLQRPV
jgi:succinyl-diaminopimelate desuccinylase